MFHLHFNATILAQIGLIAVIVKLTIFAEVFICVDYFLRTSGRGVKADWAEQGGGRDGLGL